MLEIGGGLDFLQEPPCADDGRQLRVQHLERDLAIVLDVVHEIDRSHTAGPEFSLERVTIGEGRAQGEEASRGGAITHAGRFRFGHGSATSGRGITGEDTRALSRLSGHCSGGGFGQERGGACQ